MKKNPFIVTGVELPIRTKKATTNRQRWDEFASRLEKELNSLLENGHELISHQLLEGHGAVLIARQKDEESEEQGQSQVAPMDLSEALRTLLSAPPPPSLGERVAHTMLSEVLASFRGEFEEEQVVASLAKASCEKHLKPEPPEVRSECLRALDAYIEEHKKGHADEQCLVLLASSILRKEIADFIQVRVN